MADDDPNFREIITEKLASVGFEVHAVATGAEIVKAAKELQPDLILMDIRMPGEMNGIDAAFKIKEDPATTGIKIVFLSDSENPWPAVVGDKAEVSRAFGMEDFIPKTEYLDVFVGKIKQFLGSPAVPGGQG
jgi:CheY-like chemotaxis protein